MSVAVDVQRSSDTIINNKNELSSMDSVLSNLTQECDCLNSDRESHCERSKANMTVEFKKFSYFVGNLDRTDSRRDHQLLRRMQGLSVLIASGELV